MPQGIVFPERRKKGIRSTTISTTKRADNIIGHRGFADPGSAVHLVTSHLDRWPWLLVFAAIT